MKKLLIIFPVLLGVLFFACSDDDDNPIIPDDTTTSTWIENGGYWSSFIDASDTTVSAPYTYFNFATQETVSITDEEALTSDAWDIAFKRFNIKLNGGVSGNKGVVGVDLAVIGSPDSIDFDTVIDTSDVTASDWVEDDFDLVVDEWYSYNSQTHQLTPTNYVYLLKDADGKNVKFQVIDLFDGSMPPNMGSVTCRFVHAGDGRDVSGAPDTVTLDVGAGTGYLDFSTASEVTPADPTTSTEWDIAFTEYEIHLNATVFGPGYSRAYPAYQDTELMDSPTGFDSLTTAPLIDNGYFSDSFASALTDWYNYTGSPLHQLPSKDHVYLIKVDDHVYKLQIYSYYHPDLPASEGDGYFTFYWSELE